jgi:hypothetical protein
MFCPRESSAFNTILNTSWPMACYVSLCKSLSMNTLMKSIPMGCSCYLSLRTVRLECYLVLRYIELTCSTATLVATGLCLPSCQCLRVSNPGTINKCFLTCPRSSTSPTKQVGWAHRKHDYLCLTFVTLTIVPHRYLLATCTVTPLYGRLCDIIGRRAAVQTAVVLALMGCIASALSKNMLALIFARFVSLVPIVFSQDIHCALTARWSRRWRYHDYSNVCPNIMH